MQCPNCKGSGTYAGKCWKCGGSGTISWAEGFDNFSEFGINGDPRQFECPVCGSEGTGIFTCQVCHGSGAVENYSANNTAYNYPDYKLSFEPHDNADLSIEPMSNITSNVNR
ncbi:MAG: hypothetical protein A2X28_05625 [Elusimicrobia bacterium GWA2_56_46]|nr:MAG: hypothetical protein A2X28_05625 [Elusimicrobia bacterium GWA2_56_46]OGR53934.1 MAG: hypothetical protein A2X39_07320 [Elusimicrobia bacterium GWC2_56_31]HBB68080.1 hypothetical protein [Elusimicrobiota bacterium]HBW23220.1 hypothetical protein [Elusimicrobiota bacterium]